MTYKYVSTTVVDVWFGMGWLNWARFEIKRIKGKVFLTKTAGIPIPNQMFSDLCRELETSL
ncbi:MAG: hypothetical protein NUV80_06535 [Candidatus Berkelbacteria bacterium]|nr:hypothetical protein [Candidatus Berkelbacteria bacterium]